jgi:hypothetical protein
MTLFDAALPSNAALRHAMVKQDMPIKNANNTFCPNDRFSNTPSMCIIANITVIIIHTMDANAQPMTRGLSPTNELITVVFFFITYTHPKMVNSIKTIMNKHATIAAAV